MWYLWEASNGKFCVMCLIFAKVKRVTLRLGRDFVCGRCKKQADGFMDSVEELCEEVETVRGFSYLGDRVCTGPFRNGKRRKNSFNENMCNFFFFSTFSYS